MEIILDHKLDDDENGLAFKNKTKRDYSLDIGEEITFFLNT